MFDWFSRFFKRREVNYDKAFIIKSDVNHVIGVAYSFKELQEKVDLKSFNFHRRNGRNDFANWVLNSLRDKELFEKLKKVNSFEEFKRLNP